VVVTLDTKLLYVQLLADWHLQARLGPAAAAFAAGLHAIIPRHWFRMFSAGELNQLISGGKEGGLDVEDMQR
jgi:ubiquitin-protein ligase E3 B/ubiquitin-protein ligase E3 C